MFPFLRELGGDGSTYSEHMKDARFTIPTPALLSKVVDMLDDIPMEDRDTNGDLYEYMLEQDRHRRHQRPVPHPAPHHRADGRDDRARQPTDDHLRPGRAAPAGFLVAAAEYVRREHPRTADRRRQRQHFHQRMFHGYDFDSTMLRIGSMNMLLHGVENPDIRYRDSLSEGAAGDAETYTLILANPPFAGSLDYESTAKDLQRDRQDQEDRAAVPRPLPAAAQARRPGRGHRARRRAVRVVQGAQGAAPDPGRGPEARRRRQAALRGLPALRRCLDRDPVLHQDQLRRHRPRLVLRLHRRRLLPRRQAQSPAPRRRSSARARVELTARRAREEQPARRRRPVAEPRQRTERDRARAEQSFSVPATDIAAQGYDLSINRYKEVIHDEVEHRPPVEIIAELRDLEAEIKAGLDESGGDAQMKQSSTVALGDICDVVIGRTPARTVRITGGGFPGCQSRTCPKGRRSRKPRSESRSGPWTRRDPGSSGQGRSC